MFEQVAIECDRDEELYKEFSKRLYHVVTNSEGTGWWFHEDLTDCYYMIEWVHDEEDDE